MKITTYAKVTHLCLKNAFCYLHFLSQRMASLIGLFLMCFSIYVYLIFSGPCADGYGVCCLNFVTACQSNVKKNVSYIQANVSYISYIKCLIYPGKIHLWSIVIIIILTTVLRKPNHNHQNPDQRTGYSTFVIVVLLISYCIISYLYSNIITTSALPLSSQLMIIKILMIRTPTTQRV